MSRTLNKKICLIGVIVLTFISFSSLSIAAPIVQWHEASSISHTFPSVYSEVGVGGPFEEFDDSTVGNGITLPGLTIGKNGGAATGTITTTNWGSHYDFAPTFISLHGGALTIDYAPGMDGFGMYIGGLEIDTSLDVYVDGVLVTNLPHFTRTSLNGYLTIKNGVGAPLFSEVKLQQAFVNGDNVIIDHLAFSSAAVPEPSTYALMVIGLLGLGVYHKRRSK